MALSAEIVFYPGAYPLRSLAKKTKPFHQLFNNKSGYADLESFAEAYANALSANPWLQDFPAILSEVKAINLKQQLYLTDHKGNRIPLKHGRSAVWSLLLISKSSFITVFGIWDGRSLDAVSVLGQGRVLPLEQEAVGFLDNDFGIQ